MFQKQCKWVAGAALACAVAATSLGCEPVHRIRDCRQLWRAVNPTLTEIESSSVTSTEPVKLRAVADRYDTLAKQLTALAFRNRQIARDVLDYQQVFSDSARALGSMASAAERKDETALRLARFDLDRHVRREKISVLKIDAYCTSYY